MEISTINLVYFSATYTTRKVIRSLVEQTDKHITEYDITQTAPETDIMFESKDLLIAGTPVYAGRIPAVSVNAFNKFKGNNTPAIIACVYGNRDYDDAVLEMKDILENNGFKIISAGVFIAQHSIFPAVGQGRPDKTDMEILRSFGTKSFDIIKRTDNLLSLSSINVKGNTPYKIPGSIPLKPKGNKNCNECGTCVKLCPVKAIHKSSPRKTLKDICISCGRCIVTCPQKARNFSGLLYNLAGKKFVKANSLRKEPETFYIK